MVNKPETDAHVKRQSLKIIRPTISERKERPEKRHQFAYKHDYIQKIREKENSQTVRSTINDEFRVLNKVGFSRKALETLPNNQLMGLNFASGM